MTHNITTLELPRNLLGFTVSDQPQPVIVESRLTRLAARQQAGMARDVVAGFVAVGLALVVMLGLAGV